jgi:hypothetical protein
MALQFKGGARIPGPVDVSDGGVAGRIPGPIGHPLWDKQTPPPPPGPGPLPKTVKTTVMPPPTKDNDSRDVHAVTLPLYDKEPAFTQIKQAPGIANCPIAAILGAMAFTSVGRGEIKAMLSETAGTVVTDVSTAGTLSNPPPGNKITSSKYFTVKVDKSSVDVSDVLYTDDHDRGWSTFYLRDPNDNCIWGAIIEKALAAKLGSYENFDATDISANAFWENLTGVKPGGFEIKPDTPLDKIIAAAKASTTVPTIGASKSDSTGIESISPFHGFSMLGLKGSDIQLYDASKAKTILISPANFRTAFQAILFRKT